ncbi:MAG: hypothetical protein ABJA86_08370 [Nocardioidaceae bacterium]
MATWALAVSTLALIVAGISAYFTWKQAAIARASLGVDEQRRADERVPSLSAEIETVKDSWHRLRITLDSAWPLASLQAAIVEGDGVSFTSSQAGVDPSASAPILDAEARSLGPGDAAIWRVQLDEERSPTVRLSIWCSDAEDRRWTLSRVVDVPYDVLKSAY